ncbi:hypothetical protein BH11MYX3_BH11MYX3_28370 [soil metagenome]
MTMTRKQFLRTIVGVGIGAAAVAAVAGCGGDDGGGSPDAPGGTCTTPSATIGAPIHGHTMMVALADVTAGVEKSYDITGTAGHTHMVTVTAANMASLKTGGTVMVTSKTGSGHSHAVTVLCA